MLNEELIKKEIQFNRDGLIELGKIIETQHKMIGHLYDELEMLKKALQSE